MYAFPHQVSSFFPSLDRGNSVARPSFKEHFSLTNTFTTSLRYVSCKSCHLSKDIPNTRLLGGDRILHLLTVSTYSTIDRSAGSVPIFIEGQELVKIPALVYTWFLFQRFLILESVDLFF
jgi:hypothetical protein